jgi:Ca2+/Na+ antiporter
MGMAVTLETVAIVAAASSVAFVVVVPFLALAALQVLNDQRGKQQEGMLVCTIYTIYTSRPLVFPNFPNIKIQGQVEVS